MKFFLKITIALVFIGILGAGFVASLLYYFSLDLPKISTLADYRPALSSKILAKDGTVLADIGLQKRDVVSIDEVPERLVNAYLAAEDDNFYNHQGIDYVGITRAMFKNLQAGKIVQGGSTITQQVAKSLLLTRERKFSRKIKELLLAWRIENKFSKREILHLYLNQEYLGGGYYGVKSAFKGYFGKELEEATIAECAIVAGLLVAPGKYSPYVHPEYAKQRQLYVLGRMLDGGKITQAEYESAKNENIKYRLRRGGDFKAGYFTDWVRRRMIELVGEEPFLTNGFKVTTTLDWDLQQVAERAVLNGAKETDKRQGYKGHLGNLENDEAIRNYEVEMRKNLFIDKSNYFTIGAEYKKVFEIEFDEKKYSDMQAAQKLLAEKKNNGVFVTGNIKGDQLHSLIIKGESYEAVVIEVSNDKRMVYVSIGGLRGIVPYDGFKWAHERVIKDSQNFYPYVTKPSSILKRGDKVLVRIDDLEASAWNHFYKNYKDQIKDNNVIKDVKEEKFLLCTLDQEPEVQTTLLSLSPQNGEIKAFVGGTSFDKSKFDRILQARRQPGSSFKPFIYAAALENGFTPTSILIDSPEALLAGLDESLSWKPSNYDGQFMGAITLRNSLEVSRNVTTIKLASEVGVKKILDFADRICLNAKIEPNLGLSLGSFGVSMMDLVSSYGIFPNRGRVVEPKSIISIVDREGNSYEIIENEKEKMITNRTALLNAESSKKDGGSDAAESASGKNEGNTFYVTLEGHQVYDARLSYIMTDLLRGVIKHGTGKAANGISGFIGGKTGTTNNYVDAWFVGFSHNLVTGVWSGFDDNSTLGWAETGAKASLPVWITFMRAGIDKYGEQDFFTPKGIVNVKIDKKTGQLYRGGKEQPFVEAFVEGTEPGADGNGSAISGGQKKKDDDDSVLSEEDYYNFQ